VQVNLSPALIISNLNLVRIKLKDDFDTVTKVVDWDLFTGFGNLREYVSFILIF
jgi:hypothetical protein